MTQPDRVRPEDARLAGAGLAPARRLDPRVAFAALVVGIIAWVGLGVLAAMLLAREPAAAGFDLDLILGAADRVRGGLSPYDPALLTAPGVEAVDLFYSYPPVVAQLVSLLPAAALGASLVVLWALALCAWVVTAGSIARAADAEGGWRAALASAALLPLVMPMTIALLFGNLDAFFVAGYGLVILVVLRRDASLPVALVAGVALGLMALTKLYPAALGLWLLVLSVREARDGRASPVWFMLAGALAGVVVLVAVSLVGWGIEPWADYVAVLRSASAVGVIVRPNVGPAALLAGGLGGDESIARVLQVVVLGIAAVSLIWAGRSRRDHLLTGAVAAVASLVVLPLTWLHYPAALVAFGYAALVRSWPTGARRLTTALLLLAGIVAVGAVALPPAVWLAVLALLVAVERSGRR